MSAFVSVVIPAYNYAHFLGDCIDSVVTQIGVAFEIVVVDDGSTDDTADVARRYGERVRYVYQDNQGLSAARNTGIRESSGEFLTFLDADDGLAPGALAGRARLLKADPTAFAVCRNRVFGDKNSPHASVSGGRWALFTEHLDTHLCRLNIAPPHAIMFHRAMAEAVGDFDVALRGCEDYDYWLRACGAGYVPRYAESGTVRYRVHGSSMGARKSAGSAFPYDVQVHEKKATGVYGEPMAQRVNSIAGALALTDGMLHTATRIDPAANAAGQQRLVQLSQRFLRRIATELPPHHRSLVPVARLYLERLAARERAVVALGAHELADAFFAVTRRYNVVVRALNNISAALPPTTPDRQALATATLRAAAH